MYLPKDILLVVNFIREKSNKLKIKDWTDAQIACYVGEKIKFKEVIIVYENNEPAGVVFFRPSETVIYIEQIWCQNRKIVCKFLEILQTNFPFVTTIRAWHQRRSKEITFNVNQFIRIYGR